MNALAIFIVAIGSAYAGMRFANVLEARRIVRRRLQSVVARAH